jgi:DNA transposition AAA+ family ATPase
MAPALLLTMEADELRRLGGQIKEYQTAKELSDTAMVKKFPGLGSTKTYTRVVAGDLAELDLERQLNNYRAVWALIESVGQEELKSEELYEDLTPAIQLRRAIFEVFRETGNARFVLVEGDTGLGKSSARRLLIEKYGQRLLWIEATTVWRDNPSNMLAALLRAMGVREIPQMPTVRFDLAVQRLSETRVCVMIDEFHHLGPQCLNTVKTLINQTPGEFVGLAMPTLWHRLERAAYEECRQLTGNRLAERIKLTLREADIARIINRRVPGAAETVKQAVRMIMDRAPRYGNLAFVRDVCTRVAELSEGTAGPDIECWSTAISQEVASR